MDTVFQDLRYAIRQLLRSPGFTAIAVLTLGLGIGANTAIFSVVNGVLLARSPFAEPNRLVMIWETDRNSETMHEPASWPDVADFRERSRMIEEIAAFVGQESTLTGTGGEPERVSAIGVTPNFFGVLGVQPLVGRFFAAEEGRAGGPQTVVLGEDYWRARFGADPSVVGSTVRIDERPATVVGIAPAGADLGVAQANAQADYAPDFTGPDVDVYLGMEPTAQQFPRETHPFLTFGRLAPGATVATAQRELTHITAELEAAYPENEARGASMEPLDEVIFGPVRAILLVLLGAVGLVLFIACINVANLLLARTASRTREIAVRRALGASDGRIGRQLLVESVLLVLLGTGAGLLFANFGLPALVALAPMEVPRLAAVGLDPRVLGFTAAIAAVVAIAFGLVPLLQARRFDIQASLKKQQGRTASSDRGKRRLRGGLIVAEVALAVTLVIGAGLLLRSFWALRGVDPGFRTAQVLKAEYQLPSTRYPLDFSRWPDLSEINGFNAELLRETRALPGVEAAALASPHPLDPGWTNSFTIVGREAESADFPEIRTRFISPGYLKTVGVPLISGRALGSSDIAGQTPVALLNRAAAQRYFPDADPVGHQLRFWGVAWQIVGVIGDERFQGVAEASEPAIYAPLAQAPQQSASLLVRAAGDPMALIGPIRQRFHDLDPQLALFGVETLGTTLSNSIARPRFTATLLGLFGLVALALAIIGVYGLLSYVLAQRMAEIGIRRALGATPGDVVRLVVGEGLVLTGIGLIGGLVGALAASRLLASLLFGVTATDPLTFVAVAVVFVLVALLACWLPARRATRVDPVVALRAE